MGNQSVLTKPRLLLGAAMFLTANMANAGSFIEVNVFPSMANSDTPITVDVSGTMGTPCNSVDYSTTVENQTINVEISIVETSSVCTQVITDWNIQAPIGALPVGIYRLNVNVNDGAAGSYSSTIDVAPGSAEQMNIEFDALISGDTFTFGDTLVINYLLENTDPNLPETADLKMWLEFPNGDLLSLFRAPNVTVQSGEVAQAEVLNYMLDGSEAPGTYIVGSRVFDTVRGDIIKQEYKTFQVGF